MTNRLAADADFLDMVMDRSDCPAHSGADNKVVMECGLYFEQDAINSQDFDAVPWLMIRDVHDLHHSVCMTLGMEHGIDWTFLHYITIRDSKWVESYMACPND